MDNGLFAGRWSGIPIVLLTLIFGMVLFTIAFIVMSRIDKKFTPHLIMGLTVGVLMATMSMNLKICTISLNGHAFPLVISSLFFPVLALSTDVLNEFYGVKHAKSLLNSSIVTQTMMFILMFWFVRIPSETAEMQNVFVSTFSTATRGFIAGAVSMYVCNIVDIYVFSYLRKLTKGKMLWSRVLGSTVIGLILDIAIYTSILYVGTRSFSEVFQMMLISALVRLTFSGLEVPFLYLFKSLKKRQIFLVEEATEAK